MNSPRKRNEPLAGGSERESGNTRHDENSTSPTPKYRVIGIRPSGKRSILCAGVSHQAAEDWAGQHRPFARAAGGDVEVVPE